MKMKPRFFLNLSLLAVLLASCSPVAVTQLPAAPVVIAPSATFPPPVPTLDQGVPPTQVQIIEAPTEAIAPTPFPVATSRGPNLEATDPTTVSMASGGLQFVEFFEFW